MVLFAAPLGVLVIQAFADVWRYPSLLPQSLGARGFEVAFADGNAGAAFANSLVVAVTTTVAALVLAWPAARLLASGDFRWRGLVLVVLALPLLVPPYATGTGLTEWFIRLGLTDSRTGLVLAHLTVVLPYVVLVLTSGFGARLGQLEEMAQSLGASPPRRFALVTLPAVRPTLAAAALLGFLVSWSQYGSSLAVGGGLPMLPLVMFPYIGSDPSVASALSLMFLVPAILGLLIAARAGRSAL